MPARSAAAVLLIAAPLLAGCAAALDAPTAPAGPATAPRFDVTNGPPAPGQPRAGADVVRFVSQGLFSVIDAERRLAFVTGTLRDLATGCAAGRVFAGTESHLQVVETPSEREHLQVRGRDAPMVLLAYTAGVPSIDPCVLLGAPVLGTGTVSFIQMLHTAPGGDLRVSTSAHGTVTLVGGGTARLAASEHLVIDSATGAVAGVSEVRLAPRGGR